MFEDKPIITWRYATGLEAGKSVGIDIAPERIPINSRFMRTMTANE